LNLMQKSAYWVAHNQREALLWFERLQPAEPNNIASVRSRSRESVLPVKVASVEHTGAKLLRKTCLEKVARKEWAGFNLSTHPDWPPTAKCAETQR